MVDEAVAIGMSKLAVGEVLFGFCRAVDRKKWADLARFTTVDARFDYGLFEGDLAGLQQWMAARHQVIEQSFHSIGNVLCEPVGGGLLVESYVQSSQRIANPTFASGWATALAQGRYIDIFLTEGADWRIAARKFVLENSVLLEAPETFGQGMTVGKRDDTDVLWQTLAAMGPA